MTMLRPRQREITSAINKAEAIANSVVESANEFQGPDRQEILRLATSVLEVTDVLNELNRITLKKPGIL